MTVRRDFILLAAVLLLAVAVRLAAWAVLAPPVESDGLAYMTMARGLAETGTLRDNFGQQIFYSAGYPLLLGGVMALVGSGTASVLLLNSALAVLSGFLTYRLAMMLGGGRWAALGAAMLWAVWLPAVWNAGIPAKENLSTPLLLGLLLSALALARGVRPAAFAGGLCWGAGAITGGSSLLAGGVLGLAALWLPPKKPVAAFLKSVLGIALGAALFIGPWLIASERMVGEPMLTSNAEFNLYLGNNPAAIGAFVSIADTPAGAEWEAKRIELGEAGSAHWLGAQARSWIAENPGKAARLAAIKLGLFWLPNVPDAADFAAGRLVATIRLADVALYVAVLLMAGAALVRSPIAARDRLIVAALIGGFWVLHAAAYVMPRYRDPLAPVLIALAACWLWPMLARLPNLFTRRSPAHAA